ncbi:endonuclease III [Clostridiales bacterium KA00134]|nr:endonuclease III [Clostridiales bacterium KA00134]
MAKLSKKKVVEVLDILDRTYPDAKCELNHKNAFELLIATILSAQCTDIRVNQVTEGLFQECKSPEDFINLGIEGIEKRIYSLGFYRNKAKSIMGTSLALKDMDEIPKTIEGLMKLPGVGKKTANVVASNCFGVPAIAVDTHVFRVSNRIGLAEAKNVEDTEIQLQKQIPKKRWTQAHHTLIFHGRRICSSRSPKCEICPINEYCKYYEKMK